MKHKKTVTVLLKTYPDFPIKRAEYVVGAKTIGKDEFGRNGSTLGSVTLFVDNQENIDKANRHNEILLKIEELQTQAVEIKKSMQEYIPVFNSK